MIGPISSHREKGISDRCRDQGEFFNEIDVNQPLPTATTRTDRRSRAFDSQDAVCETWMPEGTVPMPNYEIHRSPRATVISGRSDSLSR
jgi:hypothetical protein